MSLTTSTLAALASEPTNVIEWFGDRDRRTRSGAIPDQMWITVWHAAVAVAVASALTIPLAVVLAHHRKAELIATWVINIGRAVPTITVLGVAVMVSLRNGFGLEPWPILIALVLLGLPPIFTNTYAGIRAVDPSAVGAARALGVGHLRTMWRVELPLALPIVLAGVRTATVQIIATEPLGAFFGGEGLGAYIRQGLGNRDMLQVQAGALLVTSVAIAAELLLAATGRSLTPRGLRRQLRPDRRAPTPA